MARQNIISCLSTYTSYNTRNRDRERMETIPILYRVDGDREDDTNCFEMVVLAGKEVLFYDVLKSWLAWNPIGINYTFYARARGTTMYGHY